VNKKQRNGNLNSNQYGYSQRRVRARRKDPFRFVIAVECPRGKREVRKKVGLSTAERASSSVETILPAPAILVSLRCAGKRGGKKSTGRKKAITASATERDRKKSRH